MKYAVVKEVFDLIGMECEHPLCETMHKKWRKGGVCNKPRAMRTVWVVIDETVGERAENLVRGAVYDTKREAIQAIKEVTQ